MTNHIVIMAGGVGSRLYPLSTPEQPKQFIDLLECGKTLIQLTYERFLAVDKEVVFWVVTSENYVNFVRDQLPSIPPSRILAEPVPRNTAPCIAYACWKIKREFPDANIIVTPADAYVPDVRAFADTTRKALQFTAFSESIVCIGIRPLSPHTGYGYIHATGEADIVVKVSEFKEKPSLEVAQSYLADGAYWWNAGIFVWNARTIERELRLYAPQICSIMDSLSESFGTPDEKSRLKILFPECQKVSIDYAVMEKSANVWCVPAEWFWTDLGSFEALEAVKARH